jgi:hypothetical protein
VPNTTNAAFLLFSGANGQAQVTLLIAPSTYQVFEVVSSLGATRVDKFGSDLAKDGFAKNGMARYVLTGTTPVTVDLTAMHTNAQCYGGDSDFATCGKLILYNDGAHAVDVEPSFAAYANVPFTKITMEPGDWFVYRPAVPFTIDGTHHDLTVTPTAGGSLVVTLGGS